MRVVEPSRRGKSSRDSWTAACRRSIGARADPSGACPVVSTVAVVLVLVLVAVVVASILVVSVVAFVGGAPPTDAGSPASGAAGATGACGAFAAERVVPAAAAHTTAGRNLAARTRRISGSVGAAARGV